jgi:hypothetical protein
MEIGVGILNRKVVVTFIFGGLLGGGIVFALTKAQRASLAGRFLLAGGGPVWESGTKVSDRPTGWYSLSITGSTLALDTTTGKLCLTNAYPELFGSNGQKQVVLVAGPDGKPEPLPDPVSGQPMMRSLPVCSELPPP